MHRHEQRKYAFDTPSKVEASDLVSLFTNHLAHALHNGFIRCLKQAMVVNQRNEGLLDDKVGVVQTSFWIVVHERTYSFPSLVMKCHLWQADVEFAHPM